ncbi:hypothetical protein ACSVH2_07655 [Flavobacterium sp. RSB2_4_14]|uniref:hypothetical protein n=1 Tax=Flavobacterium sp. RSB2_4_14 TaxID=3447665 RepID=UPI003F32E3BE
MDIQTSKIELVKLILSIENSEFIEKVSNFIKSEENVLTELTPSQKLDIEKGIQDLNDGKRIEYSEFLKKIS